jgi:hypothetical protein
MPGIGITKSHWRAPIFEWSVEVSGWPGRFHIFSVTNVMTDVPQFFRLERGRHTTD